jgi:hypothetical protein
MKYNEITSERMIMYQDYQTKQLENAIDTAQHFSNEYCKPFYVWAVRITSIQCADFFKIGPWAANTMQEQKILEVHPRDTHTENQVRLLCFWQ